MSHKRGSIKTPYCIAVMSAVMLLSACSSASVVPTQDNIQPYDYYIDCTTREQLQSIENMNFVEGVFSFSLMQFVLPDSGTGEEQRLMLLVTDSFDNIDISSFERQLLIKEDESIMQTPDRNPIIIDETLSIANGLNVGDTLSIPNHLTEEPIVFTVGAVYQHTSLFAKYDAVILCNEQVNPAFFAVDEDIGYNAAYVKASDLHKLTDYLENEFFPGLLEKNGEMTQDNIDAIPREELTVYYEDYISHCNRSK